MGQLSGRRHRQHLEDSESDVAHVIDEELAHRPLLVARLNSVMPRRAEINVLAHHFAARRFWEQIASGCSFSCISFPPRPSGLRGLEPSALCGSYTRSAFFGRPP